MTSNCGEPTNVGSNGGLGPLPEPEFGRLAVSHDDGRWCESATGERAFSAQQMRIYAEQQVAAEREQWQRIAAAAQAVTTGAEDIGDFLVSSSLMAALALALDDGPNVAR